MDFMQLQRLSIVQGQDWADVDILRQNGFDVFTLSNYANMFEFVAKQRVDLFPRGIHEFRQEYAQHQQSIPELRLDKRLAIYYPFPRFFFTHKANHEVRKRVQQGLERAWQDGSFQTLWARFYCQNIQDAQLVTRTIYALKNDNVQSLNTQIAPYMYDPTQENAGSPGSCQGAK